MSTNGQNVPISQDEAQFEQEQQKRRYILRLMKEKEQIEEKIEINSKILIQNSVDMKSELVDKDDFPIADIDTYGVRNARRNIYSLNNDLRKIMDDIERNMEELTAMQAARPEYPGHVDTQDRKKPTPVFSVDDVKPGSPGLKAGIKEGDLITNIGNIDAGNYKNLGDLASLLRSHKDRLVKIVLYRNEERKCVYLMPSNWDGPGLTGCLFKPLLD